MGAAIDYGTQQDTTDAVAGVAHAAGLRARTDCLDDGRKKCMKPGPTAFSTHRVPRLKNLLNSETMKVLERTAAGKTAIDSSLCCMKEWERY